MSFTTLSTGGEYKHKLSINEMARHDHKQQKLEYYTALSQNDTGYAAQPVVIGSNIRPDNDNQRISFTGGDQAHNNLSPYIVVYFWRRTA